MCRATAATEQLLQAAVQRAEAAERSASQAQEQVEENGRRHASAAASLEVCVGLGAAAPCECHSYACLLSCLLPFLREDESLLAHTMGRLGGNC